MSEERRTRSLRKYEAAATPCITDPADPPIDFISPFGPMIAKTRLPEALLARINAWADTEVSSVQSSEFILPPALVNEGGEGSLANEVAGIITRYLAGLEDTLINSVHFEVFWIVSQYAQAVSPTHFHSADISGVLYLKVPGIDPAEEEKTYISGRQAGHINFLIGGKQRFAKSLISFKPQVGDFYVFPGWLLHVAEPFRGSGERRSLAFNATVNGGDA